MYFSEQVSNHVIYIQVSIVTIGLHHEVQYLEYLPAYLISVVRMYKFVYTGYAKDVQ